MAGDVTCPRPCSVGDRARTKFWSLVRQRLQWINRTYSLLRGPYLNFSTSSTLLSQIKGEEFCVWVPGGLMVVLFLFCLCNVDTLEMAHVLQLLLKAYCKGNY